VEEVLKGFTLLNSWQIEKKFNYKTSGPFRYGLRNVNWRLIISAEDICKFYEEKELKLYFPNIEIKLPFSAK
jgi:hypothetical protein